VVTTDRLVGAESVDELTVGEPAAFAILKEGRRVPDGRLVRVGLEFDAYQSQQPARSLIAGPADLVLPVGVFPSLSLVRIEPAEGAQESRLEPLSLTAEPAAGAVEPGVDDGTRNRPGGDDPDRGRDERGDCRPEDDSGSRHRPEPLPAVGRLSAVSWHHREARSRATSR
jgi:hypothetical protein